jgi:hypothetical protein
MNIVRVGIGKENSLLSQILFVGIRETVAVELDGQPDFVKCTTFHLQTEHRFAIGENATLIATIASNKNEQSVEELKFSVSDPKVWNNKLEFRTSFNKSSHGTYCHLQIQVLPNNQLCSSTLITDNIVMSPMFRVKARSEAKKRGQNT